MGHESQESHLSAKLQSFSPALQCGTESLSTQARKKKQRVQQLILTLVSTILKSPVTVLAILVANK